MTTLPKIEPPHIYSDNQWIVVHKPTGLSSHAAKQGDVGVAEWLECHHGLKTYICSRLDKGTSGVLVMALSPQACSRAQKIHEANTSHKTYYFVSDQKYKQGSKWSCHQELDDAPCETEFELIQSGTSYFLYKATITRGKTHQIRRHASLSNVPILGDFKYGGSEFGRLCLHCAEVSWPEIDQVLTADLPASFKSLLTEKNELLIETQIAHERRLNWIQKISSAFRAIHQNEVLNLPFSVDVFNSWMHINNFDPQITSQEFKNKIDAVISELSSCYDLKGGIIKTNRTDLDSKKVTTDLFHWGEPIPDHFWVHEHNHHYKVSLNSKQQLGLFLDQRSSRRHISLIAAQKRIANLFAFTGSFSVVAASAQAKEVVSVDLAKKVLDQAKENFAKNGLEQFKAGKFIKEDVRTWLSRQLKSKSENPKDFKFWDTIICNPPIFSSAGNNNPFHIKEEWPKLAQSIKEILAPHGAALFTHNDRQKDDLYYYEALEKHFSTVTRMRPPLDFPRIRNTPDTVRIYWCKP